MFLSWVSSKGKKTKETRGRTGSLKAGSTLTSSVLKTCCQGDLLCSVLAWVISLWSVLSNSEYS